MGYQLLNISLVPHKVNHLYYETITENNYNLNYNYKMYCKHKNS